ncbi:hypothetical protein AJ87_15245 [Rhizobium yanglingense]|nr:hypothetical protein AJ87_15245 [Rhizobium yanglingense]
MRAVGERPVEHHLWELDRAVEAIDLLMRLDACRVQFSAGFLAYFAVAQVAAFFGEPVRTIAGDLAGAEKFGMRRCRLHVLRPGISFGVEIAKFRHGSHSICFVR